MDGNAWIGAYGDMTEVAICRYDEATMTLWEVQDKLGEINDSIQNMDVDVTVEID